MKGNVTRKSLVLVLGIFLPSLIFGITNSVTPIIGATEVETEHETEVTNKNNEHNADGGVDNLGGKDGFHFNSNCVNNSNNEKGEVCHDNEKDRRD
jgi:hypothetical protein